jgi:hypothetical protein
MSGSQTDDDILANVPGLEDDSGSEQDTGTDQSDSASGFQSEGNTEQRREPHGERQQQQTDQDGRIIKRTDGLVERQNAANPRVRDLVDPMTGQVVAQGGVERRIYEQSKRYERDATTLRRENEQLKAQAHGYQQANSLATQLGLSAEAQSTALRVMSDFTKDPVRTIEYLIAEVKGKGYNIPSLNGQGQTTDLEAFAKLMDSRLAPIMQERQQLQRVEQANQNAKRELDNFLDQAPDARANLDVIAEMITGDPALNLNSAYIRFLTWCSANQLDPTQHVGPQLQARQQQAQPSPAQQPRQTRPLPGNRGMNGNSAIPVGSRAVHDENSEWSNIIQDSMAEAGWNQ